MKTIASLYYELPGVTFKVTDPRLLSTLPTLNGVALVFSSIKRSGRRTFVQVNSPRGTITLKLVSEDAAIEILSDEERLLTLSHVINKYKHRNLRPFQLEVNCNGEIMIYNVTDEFWNQNPKNIKVKHLSSRGEFYRIPSASIVRREIFKEMP